MVEHARRRLADLAIAENFVRDMELSSAAQAVWHGSGLSGGLVSELWVEGAFASELSDDSLSSLSADGLFPEDLCSHLDTRKVWPAQRLLYEHQSQAIRIGAASHDSESRPAIVVTAGTGLGKTEAFLLPMLASLWSSLERSEEGGMRCLILYPMNALVADQVERIYSWLSGQRKLSVFHFTSATPENHRQANSRGEPKWEECRARTREEGRGFESHDGAPLSPDSPGSVPDIVITNYSMLEYMLSRPQDSRFFGPDLECIILDEAHLYSGVLAAEIMMLLQRVKQKCGVQSSEVLHFATSATLGGDDDDLRQFASSLFSTWPDATHIIRGRLADYDLGDIESPPESPPSATQLAEIVDHEFVTLTADGDLVSGAHQTVQELSPVVSLLVSRSAVEDSMDTCGGCPAKFLHSALRRSPLIRRLAEMLIRKKGTLIQLGTLGRALFPEGEEERSTQAAAVLLRLAAAARRRSTDFPLVPHRLHFLARGPEGLALCLNPECSGPENRKVSSAGCLQSMGESTCRFCGHVVLPVLRCDNCGDWALAAHTNQADATLEPSYFARTLNSRDFFLLGPREDLQLEEVVVDTQSGEMVGGHGATGAVLWRIRRTDEDKGSPRCPTCQTSWVSGSVDDREDDWRLPCRSLSGGRPFALSVLAETMLYDLPPLAHPSKNWKPGGGRRLLCFSDSRGAAARLGPRLTQQHEIQVMRAAMARAAQGMPSSDIQGILKEEIRRLEAKLQEEDLDERIGHFLMKRLEENKALHQQASSGTPFETFVDAVARREEVGQILHRDCGDRHSPETFSQRDWEKNSSAVREQMEGLVARELERPLRRRASVESTGLLEVVYPGVDSLEMPPDIEAAVGKAGRGRLATVWPDLIALLLDSARSDGCVDWTENTRNREWLGESPLAGRWLTRTKSGWKARRFVGTTERQLRRGFAANVLRAAGCPEDGVEDLSWVLLCAAFDQICGLAGNLGSGFGWLQRKEHHETAPDEDDVGLRIRFDALSVRQPGRLYLCDSTRTVWTHSALGWAPIRGCRGTLRLVTGQELDEDPRWGRARRELRSSKVFSSGLWAEEHSAQLSPQENSRLQDLFKSGIRNILSSTTTMELGIDIGGLNGVLLGNAPPGPANHRQRGGRAGRRADGSSVVATYARDSLYDREVFLRFGKFIGRELRKPTIFLDQERVVRRHLQAVLFAEFIRGKQPARTGAMHAFGRMGRFCGVSVPEKWKRERVAKPNWPEDEVSFAARFLEFLDGLRTNGTDVRDKIDQLCRSLPLMSVEVDADWNVLLDKAVAVFQDAIGEWIEDVLQLRTAWDEIPLRPAKGRAREMAKANSIRYMVKALCDTTVIEWLADRRFLPRYGFPIHLQSLTVRKAVETAERSYSIPDERYRLERSSLLALREYVPESKVLVGGRVATSRGLRKHWTDANVDDALGLQYIALTCEEGHVFVRQSPDAECPRCGGRPVGAPQRLVFPRFGYTTAAWEKLPLGTDLERVGEQSLCPTAFAEHGAGTSIEGFAGVPEAQAIYREESELLVRNTGKNGCGFAVCTKCGFAASEEQSGQSGRMNLPKGFQTHASVYSTDANDFCWQKGLTDAPVLRNRVLAARELTDMVLIDWPNATTANRDSVYSLGRALVIGGARLLELDVRELGMALVPTSSNRVGIAVYDESPGGAGHTRELTSYGREWIDAARAVLYVDEQHDSRCRRACLDCILEFSGQHVAAKLDRRGAMALIDQALVSTPGRDL